MEKEIRQGYYEGERSLFQSRGLKIYDTVFGEGESPLKESRDIELYGSMFKWKYPLWHCENVKAENCAWFDMARAGVWYSKNVEVKSCLIEAPKNFRRCEGLKISDVSMPNAAETLWQCSNVKLSKVSAKGDYFAMNCSDMEIDGLELYGNYSFDGAENVVIRNSKLLSKDAFWNSKNITVYDSFISGEYLGWHSEDLTLINCTVESLQGMCCIKNLVMKSCKTINTTLAFEYSTVNAEIEGKIDSIINPAGGVITADCIGEIILDKDKVDPDKTKIICRNGGPCKCIAV